MISVFAVPQTGHLIVEFGITEAATIAPIAPVVMRERSVIWDQPLSAEG
jgi:hypothetical protein